MPALTKDQIAKAIAENVGLQRNRSIELVEVLIGLVKDSLIMGEDVLISGFGKFSVKSKRERRGRNPATGDSMMLRGRRVISFHCSGKLREKLNTDHRYEGRRCQCEDD
jgi:integration host factor subunit alpha